MQHPVSNALPKINVAIVGVGKIARDQHMPVIAASSQFELVACVSQQAAVDSVPVYRDLPTLFRACPQVQAVALCMPPQHRNRYATEALQAGRHVLLEKPPDVSVENVAELRAQATARSQTLFATWHSRFAAGVEPARRWLTERKLRAVRVIWREDVRHWHPNQEWIWEPGGLGVFDPGINALSIVTRLLPGPLCMGDAELYTPANKQMPIAARLHLSDADGVKIDVDFDWRQTGPQSWDIEIDTDQGALRLSHGGARMRIDGNDVPVAEQHEYSGIYRHFADLIARGSSDADAEPLRLVIAAFAQGRHVAVDSFDD
jgi:D-galactose 1-dehydrogenase